MNKRTRSLRKNSNILNLKEEVPEDVRLEVYKSTLVIVKRVAKNKIGNTKIGYGLMTTNLALLLPCVLWNLDSFTDFTPAGDSWDMLDVATAFPEYKDWDPDYEEGAVEVQWFLENIIEELTNKK